MLQDTRTAVVAHIIQLAVAPVFLLREISLALTGLRFGGRAPAAAPPPGEDVRR